MLAFEPCQVHMREWAKWTEGGVSPLTFDGRLYELNGVESGDHCERLPQGYHR